MPQNVKTEISDNSPISFFIELENVRNIRETLCHRYLSDEYFIEFRFSKDTAKLYDVDMIFFNPKKVETRNELVLNIDTSSRYFSCLVNAELTTNDIGGGFKVFKTSDSISFFWDADIINVLFFSIAENIYVGIDKDAYIKGFYIANLSENDLKAIIGNEW